MVRLPNRAQTEAWAKTLAKTFRRPLLVLLEGEMGAGKTQLVRWFVAALAGDEALVQSPTFAIHQSYPSPSGAIDHMDLYRVENLAALETTGFWDLLQQPQVLMFVEWPQILPAFASPPGLQVLRLEVACAAEPEARVITHKL